MSVVVTLAYALLAVGAAATLFRLLRGPSLADRVVATDHLLTLVVLGIGVLAVDTREGVYLEAMLIVAVVGFLGTAMVARFIEGRGR